MSRKIKPVKSIPPCGFGAVKSTLLIIHYRRKNVKYSLVHGVIITAKKQYICAFKIFVSIKLQI
ncbi:MAG TPA: hypothetical protein DCY15_03805 [Ruminococcaceae bacterium]|nr:hypothetical protein [Oscillospiraceae bacterium]